MRSLLFRIFLAFWLIITITIAAAAALGFAYAERARTALENFEVSEAMLEASEALREDGHEGLTDWLESLPDVTATVIYVLDDRGEDLLDRRLPVPIEMALRRFGGQRMPGPPARGNLRPARPFTQLIGPDDRVYTVFVLPAQNAVGRWLAERGRITLVVLALIVSGSVSLLVARAISQPVRRLRESAVAIADGNLDTRVADRIRRRDEIGLLAQDFDRMAAELERAWERQTELSRNVSHELRSPLARLRVALELARRKAGELDEFAKIDRETERLDELIGQILKYSRLDAGPHEERVEVDLDELVASVAEDVRFEYERVSDKTAVEVHAETGISVSGYPGALRSALENVLRNAMQHGHGGVVVTIDADNGTAVLTVQDQGGGLPEGELGAIFEPFYRSTGSVDSQGTGLGLAIAARAVAMHGGSIVARNAGPGLCIELQLPDASHVQRQDHQNVLDKPD